MKLNVINGPYAERHFLCLIIDRPTRKTIKEYPNITAGDAYYAKRIAANLYSKEVCPYGDWYVDCLEIEP
jgi:hypothetical protein